MQSTVTRRLILKKYRASVLMFLLFEGVAVTLWLTKSNLFYLFNFSYIGSCLSVGGINPLDIIVLFVFVQ